MHWNWQGIKGNILIMLREYLENGGENGIENFDDVFAYDEKYRRMGQ